MGNSRFTVLLGKARKPGTQELEGSGEVSWRNKHLCGHSFIKVGPGILPVSSFLPEPPSSLECGVQDQGQQMAEEQ